MNVINVEADHCALERDLFAAFFNCVLRPLEWAGFLTGTEETSGAGIIAHVFKTPLWRSALKLGTYDLLGRLQGSQRVH